MTTTELPVPALGVHPPQWADISNTDEGAPAGTLLLATIVVNGCSLHLEALRVVPFDDDTPGAYFQEAAWEGAADEYERFVQAAGAGMSGPFDTITIPDQGEYVLLATPQS